VVDDDAINAEKKLATTMLVGGVAGGVGGYFLGRSIDRKGTDHSYQLNEFQKQEVLDRLAGQELPHLLALKERYDQAVLESTLL
jgi:hypothetical protein